MNIKSQDETFFWKKKEFVSFILSILVLFIHSYFAPTVLNDSFISLFNHKFSFFFSRSITRYAVPMFFYVVRGIVLQRIRSKKISVKNQVQNLYFGNPIFAMEYSVDALGNFHFTLVYFKIFRSKHYLSFDFRKYIKRCFILRMQYTVLVCI